MEKFYNSERYFVEPLLEDSGFREYDARWIIEPLGDDAPDVQINYLGLMQIGNRLGEFLRKAENGGHAEILVGHDFRKYSENAKNALSIGLLASGLNVHDIGLCLTPMAYAAQYLRKISACAMVTASHNPNGWTGVKMGHGYSQTFGPALMQSFKEFATKTGTALRAAARPGTYQQISGFVEEYLQDLLNQWTPQLKGLPRLRVAVETGNGTGGIILPRLLSRLGFEVVPGHVELDWNFPNFNPNPESVLFLQALQGLVKKQKVEVGICLDGDGDRIGIVDDRAEVVFNDRVGVLIAKWIEKQYGLGKFVTDVKSTSLFSTELKSEIIWEKTGHSYIKATLRERQATAGFERSGHFFFREPFGRGYDDGCISVLMVLRILCEAKSQGRKLSDLLNELPKSWQSPNRQPVVPEARKYEIVDEIRARIESLAKTGAAFSGVKIKDLMTINGVRVNFVDGSWLLIRASSNLPNLVILAESYDKDGSRLKEMDKALRKLIADIKDIGPFDKLYEF